MVMVGPVEEVVVVAAVQWLAVRYNTTQLCGAQLGRW